jgi:hypothetical protein
MTLTAQQLTELRAGHTAAEWRYFSGPFFKSLVQAGITSSLAGWTAPDTGKPGSWTEITDYVYRAGSFARKQEGSGLTWEASLSGHSYDRETLGVNKSIACWTRRWTTPVNLIVNPCFTAHTGATDDSTPDTFTGWLASGAAIYAMSGAPGGNAIKIVGAAWDYIVQVNVPLVGTGTVYRLSFSAKGGAGLAQVSVTGTPNVTITAATDWTRYSLTCVSDGTPPSLVFYTTGGAGAPLYIANVDVSAEADGWQAWEREYVGQFLSADGRDDYRQGQAWTRRVEGVESYLRRINAAHLSAGLTRVTDGASVEVRDNNVLADPSLERDKGEYLGGVAETGGDKIVDGRLETVFISQYVPGVPAPAEPSGVTNLNIVVSEVFIRPPTGYDTNKAWWIELFNGSATDSVKPTLRCASWVGPGAGDYAPLQTLAIDREIPPRRFAVVCGDKAVFEELTGSGHRNAAWVIDATEQSADFSLHFVPAQTDGIIMSGTLFKSHCCVYAPAGASRTYGSLFTGAAFNSSALATGDSIERDMSTWDYGASGSERYAVNSYPVPGEYKLHHDGEHPGVALKVELTENVHTLAQGIGTSSTSVPLNSALGFYPYGGTAICESDTFTYTGLSGNTLTGVSGVSATHNVGARVYPYVDGIAQTGYPLYALTLRRRKTPYVNQGEIYWSSAAGAAMYHEPGWTTDYSDIRHVIAGNNAPDYRVVLAKRSGTYSGVWVRTLLVVINRMTDDGRAKLNELECELEMTYTGTDYTRSQPGDLVRLLLLRQAGMVTTDIVDATAYAHPTGFFATGIVPVAEVLNSLAQRSGCLIDYNPDGKVYVRDDPHWPGCSRAPIHNLAATDWRGELAFTDEQTTCDWVIINGTVQTASGPQAWRKVWPQPIPPATEPDSGKQGVELEGYVTASEQGGLYLAYAEWERRQGPGKLQLTATGFAPWAAPGQIIGITHAFGLGVGYVNYRRYYITRLRRTISDGALAYEIEAERLWY